MSIYRRKFSDGERSTRSKRYSVEFTFRGRRIRKHGFPDRESAKDWMQAEQLKLRRGAVGYIKALTAAQVSPLIEQYVADLAKWGRDAKYCRLMRWRLRRVSAECGWLTLGKMTLSGLQAWAASEPKYRELVIKPRTINQFLDSAAEFGKWLARPEVAKLPASPFVGLTKLAAKHNDAYRRAGTEEELNKLLATCPEAHRLFYLFRIYTPMRGRTIRHLTWGMMHLDATPPFAKTPAEWNKSRREQKHVIRYEIATMLRKVKRRAKATALVFPGAPTINTLRKDLKTAGVAFDDGHGNRRLDFHAFRRTLVRIGKKAGLSLDQVATLLGHRSIETTRKWYDEDTVQPEIGESLEKLPTLGAVRKAQ